MTPPATVGASSAYGDPADIRRSTAAYRWPPPVPQCSLNTHELLGGLGGEGVGEHHAVGHGDAHRVVGAHEGLPDRLAGQAERRAAGFREGLDLPLLPAAGVIAGHDHQPVRHHRCLGGERAAQRRDGPGDQSSDVAGAELGLRRVVARACRVVARLRPARRRCAGGRQRRRRRECQTRRAATAAQNARFLVTFMTPPSQPRRPQQTIVTRPTDGKAAAGFSQGRGSGRWWGRRCRR